MAVTERFLLAMMLIFLAPSLVWRVCRTDYYAPLVVVQIVAGVVLGPGISGHLFPQWQAFVFAPGVMAALNGIAWWAVMLFVWIAGLELDLTLAWDRRFETGLTAGLALLAPLATGALAGAIVLRWCGGGWIGAAGTRWQFVAGVGMACAVTALPILLLLMEKLAILREPLGQRILRYASLDDVAIWGVLALILTDWGRLGREAAFLGGFAGAAWLYRKLMPRLSEADRWIAGPVWLLAASFAADWAGLHFMVGAFLAGAVTEAGWFERTRVDRFRETVLTALMPVFFLSTGLRTDWVPGDVTVIAAAGLLLAAAVAGKHLGVRLAGRILGWGRGEAGVIAWLLQTKALIMIIFVAILLDRQIITAHAFTALLLMAVTSTMLTVPMAAPRLARLAAPRRRKPTAGADAAR